MADTRHDGEETMVALEGFGLDADEQAVYLALLEVGRGDAATVGAAAGTRDLDTAAVTRILDAFEARGMVARSKEAFVLVDPAFALSEIVAAHERDLHHARLTLDDLTARYRRRQGEGVIDATLETITDPEAAVRRLEQIYSGARHEVMAMERPPYSTSPATPNQVELDLLNRGVTHRVLYENSAVDQPGRLEDLRVGIAAGEQARVTPEVPGRLLIVDRTYAVLPPSSHVLLTRQLHIVHRGALLDMLIALFEATWNRSIPFTVDTTVADDAADRAILALMASGLTDGAIARELGLSPRTMQRRIRELCDRLGAQSRFQAGIQAARQGLI
ncbi:helix-turn-helix transcriptional regulator [Microbacterium hominis]|uniref:Helix-turn-helix transcriptional regulator n=1 Tax=Microbacterium hominis TaxID=162426 RepID=A0A7D4PSU4_9MICO|nr:helix-turn-helix transcriptional regulator [Microbacterium hominis]QKJ18313.1 helix-turn-helix transcriptional regulator [Microbacterium hominis]